MSALADLQAEIAELQTTLFDDDVMSLDPSEAPYGYRAELKVYRGYNICRDCDWRAQCNDPDTDLTAPRHRCMGYAMTTFDGRTVQRSDGCCVVFRKL